MKIQLFQYNVSAKRTENSEMCCYLRMRGCVCAGVKIICKIISIYPTRVPSHLIQIRFFAKHWLCDDFLSTVSIELYLLHDHNDAIKYLKIY